MCHPQFASGVDDWGLACLSIKIGNTHEACSMQITSCAHLNVEVLALAKGHTGQTSRCVLTFGAAAADKMLHFYPLAGLSYPWEIYVQT